ncbi:hypothetical protein [Burkholderia gladioli]|uniref:hypothetical protein n=1 Tax=Burkholderia gladioli TaxID=28095 RepID=UPI0016408660|nr:hypothetical protein [Burkholderia gladioli]
MKDIKSLSSKIDKNVETIARLQAEREQAEATVALAGSHDEALAERQAERQRLMATALVLKRKPDTVKVDAEIEQLEALRATAMAAADVARASLPIYDNAIEIAQSELAAFLAERKQVVVDHIMATHDAAQKRYLEAVAAMESAVVEMVGADLAYRSIFKIRPEAENAFPGRGKQVLEDVRKTGVRVPWDHSRLKDPAIAQEYTDDYRNYWYLPAWAAHEHKGIGDTCATQLVSDAIAGGFPCAPYVGSAPTPQKMVKVRIVRGMISQPGKRLIAAKSGEIISQESLRYSEGDDIEIEETHARQMAADRRVVIHGEGDLPPSRAELARGVEGPRSEDGTRLVEMDLARKSPPNKHQPSARRASNERGFVG